MGGYMSFLPHFSNTSTMSILTFLLCFLQQKEHAMNNVQFNYIRSEEYEHLIDLYFKLEVKYALEKIWFEQGQGSFNNTDVVEAA